MALVSMIVNLQFLQNGKYLAQLSDYQVLENNSVELSFIAS
jgi:hypothetical protein